MDFHVILLVKKMHNTAFIDKKILYCILTRIYIPHTNTNTYIRVYTHIHKYLYSPIYKLIELRINSTPHHTKNNARICCCKLSKH